MTLKQMNLTFVKNISNLLVLNYNQKEKSTKKKSQNKLWDNNGVKMKNFILSI